MAYTFPGESADLEVMLGDSLHSITVAGDTHGCFYHLRGEVGSEGSAAPQVLRIEVATVKADHFPQIAEGDVVSIAEKDMPGDAGTVLWTCSYTVLQVLPAGAMTELLLQRAE